MTRRLLPNLGLASVLDALLTARKMRPGLAPGDALAAVVESAREAEEVALAEGWDDPVAITIGARTPHESLAWYLQRALAGQREEHRLRIAGEQAAAAARAQAEKWHAELASQLAAAKHAASLAEAQAALIAKLTQEAKDHEARSNFVRATLKEVHFHLRCAADGLDPAPPIDTSTDDLARIVTKRLPELEDKLERLRRVCRRAKDFDHDDLEPGDLGE